MKITEKAGEWLRKAVFRVASLGQWSGGTWGNSTAGPVVTVNSTLQIATAWACIRLIAETIATLPMFVYEGDGQSGRKVARDFPLYALLHDQPNANMTAVEFWEAIVAQLALRGNAFVFRTYVRGTIVSLDPLRPDWMSVKWDKDGQAIFCYSAPTGYVEYTEAQVWHIKGFGLDGLIGLSPITYARNSLGGAIAADEASASMFRNGMRPAGSLSVDGILTPEQREEVRKSVIGPLTTTARNGGVIILEAKMKYDAISMNPSDAQMLETRTFNIEEICRWFRVPPSMIGHGTAASNWGTGIEQQMLGFLTFALRPYLTRIEQGIKKNLFSPVERLKYTAEFALEGLMRADSTGRAALYSSASQNGWMTRNEIRALENMPRMEGGDELTVQSNLIPLSMLGKVTSAAATAKNAFKNWLGLEKSDDNDQE